MLKKLFSGDHTSKKVLKKFKQDLEQINALATEIDQLNLEQVEQEFQALRGSNTQDSLHRGFALIRRAAELSLGQRHYDVQILGGLALYNGYIAEIKTGEGKTLTATLAAACRALEGKGVHVVTVNDYLAKRDAEWMTPVYQTLGLTVGCIQENTETKDRKTAYQADITYGSNSEFGFDYLRDHIVTDLNNKVQRDEFNFIIIDEADSILLDDARTPLILSAPLSRKEKNQQASVYRRMARLVQSEDFVGVAYDPHNKNLDLDDDYDYYYDMKLRLGWPSERGSEKAEQLFGIDSLYHTRDNNMANHLRQAITAEFVYIRDKDYSVVDGQVKIIDKNTGRVLEGQRWGNGLHQAVEAKENLEIAVENETWATVSYQNYFRLYPNISGMTGTILSDANEIKSIYNVDCISIPTHLPVQRIDETDLIYATEKLKWDAVLKEVKTRHADGQPILIGTASVKHSEHLSRLLKQAKIKHQVLNARPEYAAREAETISHAGEWGKVTVATNMAGRGVDIKLGGGDPDQFEKIVKLGGLFVLGTERHESRRIDDQLRGRSGRQGEPGESVFYISAEDDLLQLFAGEKLKNSIDRVSSVMGRDSDKPLQFSGLTKMVSAAQEKVEAERFADRKRVLEYDDVVNEQRLLIYSERDSILESDLTNQEMFANILDRALDKIIAKRGFADIDELKTDLLSVWSGWDQVDLENSIQENSLKQDLTDALPQAEIDVWLTKDPDESRRKLLNLFDSYWKQHLSDMDYLKQGISLRALVGEKPVVAYRREGTQMFQEMMELIRIDFIAAALENSNH